MPYPYQINTAISAPDLRANIGPFTFGDGLFVIGYAEYPGDYSDPCTIAVYKSTDWGLKWDLTGATKSVRPFVFGESIDTRSFACCQGVEKKYLYAVYIEPGGKLRVDRYNMEIGDWDASSGTSGPDFQTDQIGNGASGLSIEQDSSTESRLWILSNIKLRPSAPLLPRVWRSSVSLPLTDWTGPDMILNQDDPTPDAICGGALLVRGINGLMHGFFTRNDDTFFLPEPTFFPFKVFHVELRSSLEPTVIFTNDGNGQINGLSGAFMDRQSDKKDAVVFIQQIFSTGSRRIDYLLADSTSLTSFSTGIIGSGDIGMVQAVNDDQQAWIVYALKDNDWIIRSAKFDPALGPDDAFYTRPHGLGILGLGITTRGLGACLALDVAAPAGYETWFFLPAGAAAISGEATLNQSEFFTTGGIHGGGLAPVCEPQGLNPRAEFCESVTPPDLTVEAGQCGMYISV